MSLSVTLAVLVIGILFQTHASFSSLPFPQDRLPPARAVAVAFLRVQNQGICPPAFSDGPDTNCTALFDAYAPLCSSVFEVSVCQFTNPHMCDICYEVLSNCTYSSGSNPTMTMVTVTPPPRSDICADLYSSVGTFCSFVLEGSTCRPGYSSESCETCLGALQICGPGPTNGSICEASTAEFCPLLQNTTCAAMASNGTGQICDLCDIVRDSNCGTSETGPTSSPSAGSGDAGFSCTSLFDNLGDYCTYVISNGQCDTIQYSQESCDQCASVEIACGINPPNPSYTICQSTISVGCPFIMVLCGPSNNTFICDYCETVADNCQTTSLRKRQAEDICTETHDAFGSFCNYVIQDDGTCLQSFGTDACFMCQTVLAQCPEFEHEDVCNTSTAPNCPAILQTCSDQEDSTVECDYCLVVEQECNTQFSSNETLDCASTRSTFGLFCVDALKENVCTFSYSEHSCLICEFLNTTCGFNSEPIVSEFCSNALAVSCNSSLQGCMDGRANTQECDYCAFVAKTCFEDQNIDICQLRELVGGCRQLRSTSFGFECECFLPKVMCEVCQTALDVCPPAIPPEVSVPVDELTDVQRENLITLQIRQITLDQFLANEYLFRIIIAELVKNSSQFMTIPNVEGLIAFTEDSVYIVLPSPLVPEQGSVDVVFFVQASSKGSSEVVVSGDDVISTFQKHTIDQLLSETFTAAIGSKVLVGEIMQGLPSSLQPATGQVGTGVGVTVGVITLLIVVAVVVAAIAIKVKRTRKPDDDSENLMDLEEVKRTSI